jgi:hypothetical protein
MPADFAFLSIEWDAPVEPDHKKVTPSLSLSDMLAAPAGPLLKANAVIAYAEVLKNPTKAGIAAALENVSAAKKATSDPDLEEIELILARHPVYTGM